MNAPKKCSTHREALQHLRTELISVEKERNAGIKGCTPDELEQYLDTIIQTEEVGRITP